MSDSATHRSAHSRTTSPPEAPSTASYFSYPISRTVTGLLRRLSTDPGPPKRTQSSSTQPGAAGMEYTPPRRHYSPFQPPPLTPLTLKGYKSSTSEGSKLLTRTLAEEIRLLVPARLQLVEDWRLAYSLDQNGASLSTLYKVADDYRGKRGAFVLVVRDGSGDLFGAYLSETPHPSSHYYGTGESFLWRSQTLSAMPLLSALPPPPSTDTTNMQRSTTIGQAKRLTDTTNNLVPPSANAGSRSGASTPERIRFKAFPYSGINDYIMYCEHGYLSVGGGDGHYGLWLDDSLDKGVSEHCPTFGNEPLSDEGKKFDILGVELWYVGV